MEDVMIKLPNPSPAGGRGCPEGAGEGCVQRAVKVSLLRLLREDVSCVFQRDPAARSRFEVLTTYPGVHAILMQRVAHRLWKFGLRYPARLLAWFARLLTNIDIHPGATIGRRFFIDHGAGVFTGYHHMSRIDVVQGAEIAQGAAVGGIIGAVLGGVKGAVLGVLIGGGGTIAATEGKEVELPQGTVLRVRVDAPLQIQSAR